jgi:hypothetical protein
LVSLELTEERKRIRHVDPEDAAEV